MTTLRSAIITKQTVFIIILALILGVGIWRLLILPASTAANEAHATLIVNQANVVQLQAEVAATQGEAVSGIEDAFAQASIIESILRPNTDRENREFLLAYMPVLPQTVGIVMDPQIPPVPTSREDGMSYIDYSYTFDSTWPQLQAFLQAVHELPLLATVENFSTQETGTEGSPQWSSQLTVRVWWSDLEPLPGHTEGEGQPLLTTLEPAPTEGIIGDVPPVDAGTLEEDLDATIENVTPVTQPPDIQPTTPQSSVFLDPGTIVDNVPPTTQPRARQQGSTPAA